MEIGLELQEIRFHRPGCFRLAVVCRLGEKRLVHVSEASEIGAVPIWKSKAWRLQAPKDDLDGVEAQLQLRFYEEFGPNSSDCRSLLEAKPLSCCSFTLPLQRLRTLLSSAPVHSAPLFSKGRPGGQDMEEIGVVTISWGWPTSSHTELVVPEKLEVSSADRSFTASRQLEKLQAMNQVSRHSLQLVATRLSAMQQVLNALTAHEADLSHDKDQELSEMKRLELILKELKEPFLTDLDFELMLSMPQGVKKVANLLLAAEQRWKNAREDVIGRWAEFTSLRQKLGEVQRLQQQLKDFQQVHKEQQKVLAEASKRARTAREVATTCASQAKLIAQLKLRLGEKVPPELKLIHGREQQTHAVLQEKSKQLSVLVGRPSDSKADTYEEHHLAHLASELFFRTQQVMHLLKQIQRLQRPRRAKAASQTTRAPQNSARAQTNVPALQTRDQAPQSARDRRQPEEISAEDAEVQDEELGPDLLDEAVQGMVAAQLRCEDLERRNASVEEELLRRQVGSWGQELGSLQAELQKKTALLSQLEASLGMGSVKKERTSAGRLAERSCFKATVLVI